MTTSALSAAAIQQSVAIRRHHPSFPSHDWRFDRVHVCTWTAVIPTSIQNTAQPAGCTQIFDGNNVSRHRTELTVNFTPNTATLQAMRNNGGVVVAVTHGPISGTLGYNFWFAEWVPAYDLSLSGLEVLGITGTSGPGHVSQARRAMTLSPAFSSSTTSYTVAVAETVKRIRIRPTAKQPSNVTITVDGTGHHSGGMGGLIDLAAVGTGKTINVVVTPRGASSPAQTYSVAVTREAATITPSATSVTVDVGTAITDVTFTPGGESFNPTYWGVDPALPQGLSMDSATGTISGTPGRAAASATYTVTGIGGLSVSAFGEQLPHSASATVTIEVNTGVANAGVTISPGTSLTVNEGSTADYRIALTQPPQGGNVTVTPAVSGSSDVTFSPASREFTSQNYATAQSFTVTAGSDGDSVDDVATISHTATGGGYDGVAIGDISVTVDDDEELGLEITGTTPAADGSHGLVVTEGSNNTYSVALGSEPESLVTVTPVLLPGTDVTISPTSLEFEADNTNSKIWSAARSFTVTAGEDVDTTDDTVKIRHSMSSAGDYYYNGRRGPSVTVTVDDDDDAGVTLGGTTTEADGSHSFSVNEGSAASYTIKLDKEPTGNVTIRLSAGRSSSISVEKNSLSFTVNNWNVAQTVTVRAAADGNASDESVEVTHTISGGGYGSVAVPKVTVTAVDDDKSSDNDLLLLSLQSEMLSPAFNRAVTSYTADVHNSVNRVSVSAVANDRTAEVSITPADADTSARGHQVNLAVTPAVNTITISVTAQTGAQKDYTVTVTRALSTTPASFSFTDATGAEPGEEVTSDAITLDVDDESAAIPISVTSGGALVVDGAAFSGNTVTHGQTVAVKVTASSEFSTEVSATVTIGGVSDEFSVTTRAGRVNANLSALALADGKDGGGVGALALDQAVSDERTLYTARVPNSINKVKVTATAADTAATIEVNGTAVASGTESGAINVPLRDGNFSILIAVVAEDGTTEKRYKLQVKRRSTDANLSGISVKVGGSELTLGRTSGGSTVSGFSRAATAYTVRVPQATTSVEVTPTTSDPLATVTVAGGAVSRTESGTLGATAVTLSSQSSTAVSIVVTPEDSTASTKTYTVTVEKTGMRVSVTPVAVTVEEGGTGSYAVVLTAAPTAGTVTVTPTSGDENVATVSAALTFDTTDWNVPQTVTVTGLDDAVDNPGDSRKVAVTHAVTGTGTGYEGAVAATVSVAVSDDELTKVIYIGDAESLENAGTLDFTVNLSPAGSSEVTVDWAHALRSGDAGQATPGTAEEGDYDASGASGTLTFAVGETLKTISVPINDDEEEEGDERVTVILVNPSSSSDLLGISGSPATGTIKDDDTPIPPAPEAPESPPLAETPESSPEDPGASDGDRSVFSVSGGGEVTEGDSGATAQASFTVSLAAAGSREVSVGYATADGTAEAGSDYESASGTVTFSPGETSKTVSVTVNGDDEAEGNETFSLSLASGANGSVDPRNSSAQAVIANDDRKTVEAGMSGEFSVGETTVTVESTLPENAELEVVLPAELESGGTAIEELAVTLGPADAEIDADLFGYTGSGADHVLVDIDVSPAPDDAVRICLPVTENLRRAAGRQRLYMIRFSGGEWEELSSETEGDAVCADVSGFSPFALVFEIDHAGRRAGDVNRAILPELSRAMTASTLEAVTSRIGDAMSVGGTAGAFDAALPSPGPAPEYGRAEQGLRLGELEDGETLSLTDAVDGSYYSVSLAGGKPSQGGESEAEPAPASRAGGLGMWVSGDYRSLSGGGGGTADWNGRLISGHLGADYRFGRSFLAGVATSWSQGSFDYAGRGEGASRVRGDYSSRMNSFHPYLGLSLSERLALWATGGWGFGEIRMDDGEIPARQKASTRLGTLATGADLALLGGGASALSLRGEAWISRVKVEGNGDRVEGLSVRTNRLRAALEGSHALSLGSGSLVPSLEFAMRRDGGDGETGVGGELGGGISLVSSMGLAVEARGRGLLFHQGDAKEWGVGGSVRYDPGGDGRGLSMSVLPSWGNSASGVQGIWESEGVSDFGASASRREFGLQTEMGYGFAALDDRGLLTPYGAFGRPDPHSRNYRLGSRFSMNGAFDLTLEGQRRELRAGDPEHGITLQGRLNW